MSRGVYQVHVVAERRRCAGVFECRRASIPKCEWSDAFTDDRWSRAGTRG